MANDNDRVIGIGGVGGYPVASNSRYDTDWGPENHPQNRVRQEHYNPDRYGGPVTPESLLKGGDRNVAPGENPLDRYTNVYDMSYKTGAQVSVFVGPVYIDEIVHMEWESISNIAPIYAYNSRYFSTLLDGQYVIQGKFAILFKETDYIKRVIDEYQSISKSPEENAKTISDLIVRKRRKFLQTLDARISQATENFDAYGNRVDETGQNLELSAKTASIGAAETFVDSIIEQRHMEVEYSTGLFDLAVVYGDYTQKDFALRTFSNVQIIGTAQSLVQDDGAILEIYRFIAREQVLPPRTKIEFAQEDGNLHIDPSLMARDVEETVRSLAKGMEIWPALYSGGYDLRNEGILSNTDHIAMFGLPNNGGGFYGHEVDITELWWESFYDKEIQLPLPNKDTMPDPDGGYSKYPVFRDDLFPGSAGGQSIINDGILSVSPDENDIFIRAVSNLVPKRELGDGIPPIQVPLQSFQITDAMGPSITNSVLWSGLLHSEKGSWQLAYNETETDIPESMLDRYVKHVQTRWSAYFLGQVNYRDTNYTLKTISTKLRYINGPSIANAYDRNYTLITDPETGQTRRKLTQEGVDPYLFKLTSFYRAKADGLEPNLRSSDANKYMMTFKSFQVRVTNDGHIYHQNNRQSYTGNPDEYFDPTSEWLYEVDETMPEYDTEGLRPGRHPLSKLSFCHPVPNNMRGATAMRLVAFPRITNIYNCVKKRVHKYLNNRSGNNIEVSYIVYLAATMSNFFNLVANGEMPGGFQSLGRDMLTSDAEMLMVKAVEAYDNPDSISPNIDWYTVGDGEVSFNWYHQMMNDVWKWLPNRNVVHMHINEIPEDPPPRPGVQYIIGDEPELESILAAHTNHVAVYSGTSWSVKVPKDGDSIFDEETLKYYHWDAGEKTWKEIAPLNAVHKSTHSYSIRKVALESTTAYEIVVELTSVEEMIEYFNRVLNGGGGGTLMDQTMANNALSSGIINWRYLGTGTPYEYMIRTIKQYELENGQKIYKGVVLRPQFNSRTRTELTDEEGVVDPINWKLDSSTGDCYDVAKNIFAEELYFEYFKYYLYMLNPPYTHADGLCFDAELGTEYVVFGEPDLVRQMRAVTSTAKFFHENVQGQFTKYTQSDRDIVAMANQASRPTDVVNINGRNVELARPASGSNPLETANGLQPGFISNLVERDPLTGQRQNINRGYLDLNASGQYTSCLSSIFSIQGVAKPKDPLLEDKQQAQQSAPGEWDPTLPPGWRTDEAEVNYGMTLKFYGTPTGSDDEDAGSDNIYNVDVFMIAETYPGIKFQTSYDKVDMRLGVAGERRDPLSFAVANDVAQSNPEADNQRRIRDTCTELIRLITQLNDIPTIQDSETGKVKSAANKHIQNIYRIGRVILGVETIDTLERYIAIVDNLNETGEIKEKTILKIQALLKTMNHDVGTQQSEASGEYERLKSESLGVEDDKMKSLLSRKLTSPSWERNFAHVQVNVPPSITAQDGIFQAKYVAQDLERYSYMWPRICNVLTYMSGFESHIQLTKLVDRLVDYLSPEAKRALSVNNRHQDQDARGFITRLLQEELQSRGQSARLSITPRRITERNTPVGYTEQMQNGKWEDTPNGLAFIPNDEDYDHRFSVDNPADVAGPDPRLSVLNNRIEHGLVLDIRCDTLTPTQYVLIDDLRTNYFPTGYVPYFVGGWEAAVDPGLLSVKNFDGYNDIL